MNFKSINLGSKALVILMILTTNLWAQVNVEWAINPSDIEPQGGKVEIRGSEIDVDGNVYLTGLFTNTADFDPSESIANMTCLGITDIWLSKYDSLGNYIWSVRAGGMLYNEGTAISVDSSGNVYLLGHFSNTAYFDSSDSSVNLTSHGDRDIFLAKYDSEGNILWVNGFGGSWFDFSQGITLDSGGDIFIAGYFSNTFIIDSAGVSVEFSSNGQTDIFISKFNENGAYLWTNTIGDSGGDFCNGIHTDLNGDVFICGSYYSDTLDFDPSAAEAIEIKDYGSPIFLAKYDNGGSYQWVNSMWGQSAGIGMNMDSDSLNNIYLTGQFSGTLDFDPTSNESIFTSKGGNDVFLAKYTSIGGYEWAISAGGTSSDYGAKVAVDEVGNAYIVGNFSGEGSFDAFSGQGDLSSNGWSDVFVAKYDPFGQFLWVNGMGSKNSDKASGVLVDTHDKIWVMGDFNGLMDIDPSEDSSYVDSRDLINGFIAKYESDSGSYVYDGVIGNYDGEADDQIIQSMATDSEGNVFVCGSFRGVVDFDPTESETVLKSNGLYDIFIAKYDSDGFLKWVNSAGSSNWDEAYDLAINQRGELYITGYFQDSVDFDPSIAENNLVSIGSFDAFVAKYSNDGDLIWAKSFGGESSDAPHGIAIGSTGDVFLTGRFLGTTDFDPSGSVANLSSNGNIGGDVFIARYDSEGNYIWAKGFGGTQQDGGQKITLDDEDNIYLVGKIEGKVDFDPSSSQALHGLNTSSSNHFVAKYDQYGGFIWANAPGGSVAFDISLDSDMNVYAIGVFSDSVDFAPTSYDAQLLSKGSQDVFLIKYNKDGKYIWVKDIGGESFDQGYGVHTDVEDNVYIIGSHFSTISIDNSLQLSSIGSSDAFVAKFTKEGSIEWAANYGGVLYDEGFVISTDIDNDVFIAGSFDKAINLDSYTLNSENSNDAFIGKLWQCDVSLSAWIEHVNQGNDGAIQMTATGGVPPYNYGFWDYQEDTLILSVANQSGLSAGNYTIGVIDAQSCFDTLKVTLGYVGVWEQENLQCLVYPSPNNGIFTIEVNQSENLALIEIIDVSGSKVYSYEGNFTTKHNVDLSHLSSGVYIVRMKTNTRQSMLPVIIN